MGLNSALVDRARVLRENPTATKVEGSTVFDPAPHVGAWFRCRLEPALANEATGPGGFKTVTKSPVMMYGIKDSAGAPIALDNEDKVEVDAPRFAQTLGADRTVWLVTQDPEPMPKKRRVIGHQVQLQRVEKHEFIPA